MYNPQYKFGSGIWEKKPILDPNHTTLGALV